MSLLLQERVRRVEEELVDIKKCLCREEDKSIPPNYMNISEFVDRFKFLSGSQLSKWVCINENFFKPIKIRRKVFLDPLIVIDYIMKPPTQEEGSVRVMNSFLKLRDDVEALRELYDKWKQFDARRDFKEEIKLPLLWGQ